MRNTIITASVCILLGLGAGWLAFHSPDKFDSANGRKILYYRDPMNSRNTSPTPKKGPDGMDFVPVYSGSPTSDGSKKIAYYKDPMHPWYTSDKPGKAPDCGMDLVPVYEGESDSGAIHIDPVTMQNIGVTTEVVKTRSLARTIRATGKIDYDETKVYSVSTKVMGYVEHLNVDYSGQEVRKGEALMDLYSPELVGTQQEYLQAIQYQKELQNSNVPEARKEADELVQSSRQRLLYWDIPESEIKALEERGTPKKTMTIVSPVDGVVTDEMVLQGQNVMAGMTLYKIADLSSVWVLADIYQYELPWVQVGQKAEIQLSYIPGKSFTGAVDYIYPYLGTETKTAKVRVKVHNPAGTKLKPGMYASINLTSPVEIKNVAVPERAVIRSGERSVVVVALGGGYFAPRDVKTGVESAGYVEILSGVNEGERVVTSSQFLIDSESNLKAALRSMNGHQESDTTKSGSRMDDGERKNTDQRRRETAINHKRSSTDGSKNNSTAIIKPGQPAVDPVCGLQADGSDELSFVCNG